MTHDASRVKRHLAIAGLLHDVGKFYQRTGSDREKVKLYLPIFCPPAEGGRYTRWHAAFTALFFEENLRFLWEPGAGDNHVQTWAAKHHAASRPLEWIVQEADRLASAQDRGQNDESYEGWDAVVATRLLPILAVVGEKGAENLDRLSIPLEPLSPTPFDPLVTPTRGARTTAEHEARYREFWTGFVEGVRSLPRDDDARFVENLDGLLERYASAVPASTTDPGRDVSLYNHSRAVAAIAVALYDELTAGEGLEEIVITEAVLRDRACPRFALLAGDLFGIQDFIYTIPYKGAARQLRGRSFGLHLMSEAIAFRLLRVLDLPLTNLIYVGGGKMFLLVPARSLQAARVEAGRIDAALLARHRGRLGFGLGARLLSGEDLKKGQCLGRAWREALEDLRSARQRRFRGLPVDAVERLFEPQRFLAGSQPCPVCGVDSQDVGETGCEECAAFDDLGTRLNTARWVIRIEGPQADLDSRQAAGRTEGGAARVVLPDLETAFLVGRERPPDTEGVVLALNPEPDGESVASAFRWVACNRPESASGKALTYEDLADRSTGASRLGVLRMDVDNLGSLFHGGFAETPGAKRPSTFSRLAQLSRDLARFFGGGVYWIVNGDPELGDRVHIVYSGGDDLFVVGALSEMPRLALAIRRAFSRAGGENPALSLSGGLAVVSGRYPIARAAEVAHALEAEAKAFERPGGGKKDALAFFGRSVGFEAVSEILGLARELALWVSTPEERRALSQDSAWRSLTARAVLPDPDGERPIPGTLLREMMLLADPGRSNAREGDRDALLAIVQNRLRFRYRLRRALQGERIGARYRGCLLKLEETILGENDAVMASPVILEKVHLAAGLADLMTRKRHS